MVGFLVGIHAQEDEMRRTKHQEGWPSNLLELSMVISEPVHFMCTPPLSAPIRATKISLELCL